MAFLEYQVEQRIPYAVLLIRINGNKRIPRSDPDIELMQEFPDAVGIGLFIIHVFSGEIRKLTVKQFVRSERCSRLYRSPLRDC